MDRTDTPIKDACRRQVIHVCLCALRKWERKGLDLRQSAFVEESPGKPRSPALPHKMLRTVTRDLYGIDAALEVAFPEADSVRPLAVMRQRIVKDALRPVGPGSAGIGYVRTFLEALDMAVAAETPCEFCGGCGLAASSDGHVSECKFCEGEGANVPPHMREDGRRDCRRGRGSPCPCCEGRGFVIEGYEEDDPELRDCPECKKGGASACPRVTVTLHEGGRERRWSAPPDRVGFEADLGGERITRDNAVRKNMDDHQACAELAKHISELAARGWLRDAKMLLDDGSLHVLPAELIRRCALSAVKG